MRNARTIAIAGAAMALAAGTASAELALSFDEINADGLGFGQTDAFSFGGYGLDDFESPCSPPPNPFVAFDVDNAGAFGGFGISTPLAPDDAAFATVNGGGGVQNGNVVRFSCWIASDPRNPFVNTPGIALTILKMEFWDVPLGLDRGVNLMFDTEVDAALVTDWASAATSTTMWTQVSFTYEIDDLDFVFGDLSTLAEIRPVLFAGDFTGADGNTLASGGVVVDNWRVEVFADAAAEAATALDTTNPGDLPSTDADQFLFCDFNVFDGGFNANALDFFQFGSWIENSEAAVETNEFGGWIAGEDGGAGFSIPIPAPAGLANGNVLRLSCWLGSDPNLEFTPPGVGTLKFEFWNTALSLDSGLDENFDTEIDGGIVSDITTGWNSSGWTQFVFEYTIDDTGFLLGDITTVAEIRPVLIWFGGEGSGQIFVDNIVVEIFDDASAAAASPVDTTDPGDFPERDCPCDFNDSGTTDITDLLGFLSCWFPASQPGGECP